MSEEKRKHIEKALQTYTKIFPCGKRERWEECFTIEGNFVLFWFNTEDQSTHLLKEYIYQ